MQYYDNMTRDEYVDSYLTGNLPDSEMVAFEFNLLDDDILAGAFDERLEAHKVARKAFGKWSSETGLVSLRLYVDGKFEREIKVKDEMPIILSEGQSCRVEDSDGNVVLENVIPFKRKVKKRAPLPHKRLKKVASTKFEATKKQVVYKQKKLIFNFIKK